MSPRKTPAPDAGRFTACGLAELEARVLRDLSGCVERLLDSLPRDAVAGVALSGAYGRGEGGAWWRDEELLPHDDYELYIAAAALPRATVDRLALEIRTVGVELSGRVGVRVMVHLIDRATLRHPPATRAMADLRAGHRVLVGPPGLFRAMPGPRPAELPPIEGTRLVLAGVSRLTRARASLPRLGEPAVAARVARDVRAAWLAAGEGWLIAHRRYDPSTHERLARVWRDATLAELRHGYVATARELLEGARPPDPATLPAAILTADAALRSTLAEVERVRVAAPVLDGGVEPAEATFPV